MPKVSWHELNDLVHNVKNELTQLVGIELKIRQLKKSLAKHIDEMHRIILEQVNDGTDKKG